MGRAASARTSSGWKRAVETAWRPSPDEARADALIKTGRERLIPVFGAGMSKPAGLMLARELAEAIAKNFRPAEGNRFRVRGHLHQVADQVVGADLERSIQLRQWVAEQFDVSRLRVEPTPAYHALVDLPSGLIVSLNYDELPEVAVRMSGRSPRSFTHEDVDEVIRLINSGEDLHRSPVILHLHGIASRPETIVLDDLSERSLDQKRIGELLWELGLHKTLCFFGITVDEPPIIAQLQEVAPLGGKHVIFADTKTREQIEGGRNFLGVERHGVLPITVEHGDLDDAAAHVRDAAQQPVLDQWLVRLPKIAALSGYEPNVVVEERLREEDQVSRLFADLSVEDRPQLRRLFAPQDLKAVAESDVALGSRTLLAGPPGSGKTEFLREVATHVAEGEEALFIRLSSARFQAADPEVLLCNWIKTAEGFPEGVAVSGEVLEANRFHFFLDGLDEIAPPEQARATKTLIEVAKAYPHHRFTVSTRPVEEAALFAEDDWRLLKLVPGEGWQKRFLEKRGLRWADLEDTVPSLRDLRDLLCLPFFLSEVVRLYRENRLKGLRDDLWAILQELTVSALERDRQLPLPVDPARRWLRRVALAMHLAGRTQLSVEELEQVPLPEGYVGDHGELCQALVQRATFQPRLGGYAFTHRMIGEGLAAEALDKLPPSEALLAAIAPSRNELVRGIRRDWFVPLSLLLSRNEAWRDALADRDPMQVARTTPSSAPTEVRRAAAERLWRTYTDWEIWIYNYDVPRLINDAAAVARLIRAGGLDELVAEIRAGIDHQSPQVQGNALRVLSLAEVSDLEADLRRVLEDDERESVVRRKAAIAASDMKLHSLLPLLIRRAASPEDSSEAQDASIALRQLTRNDEVIDVLRQLAKSDEAWGMAVAMLDDRVKSPDLIGVLKLRAEANLDRYSNEEELLREAVGEVPPEEIRPELVEDAAFAAAAWGVHGPAFLPLFEREPQAALRGMLAAIEQKVAYWWALDAWLAVFSLEDLEAAGAPEPVLQHKRRLLEAPEPRPVLPVEDAEAEIAVRREKKHEPTLAELVARPREQSDQIILGNAHYFSKQAAELLPDEKATLGQRLQDWWPEQPFHETISIKEQNGDRTSWTFQYGASTWFWFGPVLDLPLSAQQWAEIACSLVLFEEQTDWLKRQCSPEAVAMVAEICRSPGATAWSHVVNAIPGDLPDVLVDAISERLSEGGRHQYELRNIGDRLAAQGRLDAVRQLSEVSDDFAVTFRPHLARAGDPEALRLLLDELAEDLRNGRRPDSEDLHWLAGARDPALLPKLFEALLLAYKSPLDQGRTFADTGTPLRAAIIQIGGEEALRAYDEILKNDEEVHFLRLQREEVLQAELALDGLTAAAQACASVGLPYFATSEETFESRGSLT